MAARVPQVVVVLLQGGKATLYTCSVVVGASIMDSRLRYRLDFCRSEECTCGWQIRRLKHRHHRKALEAGADT